MNNKQYSNNPQTNLIRESSAHREIHVRSSMRPSNSPRHEIPAKTKNIPMHVAGTVNNQSGPHQLFPCISQWSVGKITPTLHSQQIFFFRLLQLRRMRGKTRSQPCIVELIFQKYVGLKKASKIHPPTNCTEVLL